MIKVYKDYFEHFISPDFERLMTEGRKYGAKIKFVQFPERKANPMLNRNTFIRNEQQRDAFLDWFGRTDPYTRQKELVRLAGWRGALKLTDRAMKNLSKSNERSGDVQSERG